MLDRADLRALVGSQSAGASASVVEHAAWSPGQLLQLEIADHVGGVAGQGLTRACARPARVEKRICRHARSPMGRERFHGTRSKLHRLSELSWNH